MHCDEATARLLDLLDQPTDRASPSTTLEAHLSGCDECRALQEDIAARRAEARVWHDLEPPPWNPEPPRGHSDGYGLAAGWQRLVQLWLPLAASTAALLLAVSVYRQDAAAPLTTPLPDEPQLAELAGSPAAQALLAASRRERQQEMAALTALLKAELDRQEAQTEESLKYLISHQIQSQRELDAVRGRLLQTDARSTEQL